LSSKSKIKVLVVDDHPVVRKGLESCLSQQEHIKWVGAACDGEEALAKARELLPDVILMDIDLPGKDGLEITELLRKQLPQVKVLVLSIHNHREYILRIIRSGAQGYVSKEASPAELLRAVQAVFGGEAFFSPEMAKAALDELVSNSGKEPPITQLTTRERQVLALIANGQSNKEIASELAIGVRTAETHRERIMRKLEIHSVAGLTRFAIQHRIVKLEEPPDAAR
jgi:two-component system, NarL family, nitrate/nitrite response regulator NarL